MMGFAKQHELALISCVEVVLMHRGNINYNLVVAKLSSLYDSAIRDCYEHPEYLRAVLKDVYKDNYNSIIAEIKLQLDELVNEHDIANFLNAMEG